MSVSFQKSLEVKEVPVIPIPGNGGVWDLENNYVNRILKEVDKLPDRVTESDWDKTVSRVRDLRVPSSRISDRLPQKTTFEAEQLIVDGKCVYRKKGPIKVMLSEASHLRLLSQLNLKYSQPPKVLAFEENGQEATLYTSCCPGRQFYDFLEESKPEESQEALYHLGKALGELQSKMPMQISSRMVKAYVRSFMDVYKSSRNNKLIQLPTSQEIETLVTRFQNNPGNLTLAHDDPHYGNFLWDPKTQRISIIDIGEFKSKFRKGSGDFPKFSHDHPFESHRLDRERLSMTPLHPDYREKSVKSFEEGYREGSKGSLSRDAADFFRAMEDFRTLPRLTQEEAKKYLREEASSLFRTHIRPSSIWYPAYPELSPEKEILEEGMALVHALRLVRDVTSTVFSTLAKAVDASLKARRIEDLSSDTGKSLEAKEGMREMQEIAEAYATVATPIALLVEPFLGTALRAVMAPIVAAAETTCNFNVETQSFCREFVRPFAETAEKMSQVADPLITDYGFSAAESERFQTAAKDVISTALLMIPFAGIAGNRALYSFPGFQGSHVVKVIEGKSTLIVNLDELGYVHKSLYQTFGEVSALARRSDCARVWCKIFEMDKRVETILHTRYGLHLVHEVEGSMALSTYGLAMDQLFARSDGFKRFEGVLKQDLTLVRLGTEVDQGGASLWMPSCEVQSLATMEEVVDQAAILPSYGRKTHMFAAKIPAGEKVQFSYGRAICQSEVHPDLPFPAFRSGGMMQYRFRNFNPLWIRRVAPIEADEAPSFPDVTEVWSYSLGEAVGLGNLQGTLKLLEYQGKRTLLAQVDLLRPVESKQAPSAIKLFGSGLRIMGEGYGADRVLIQASFAQGDGWRGLEVLEVLKRRHGVRSAPIDLPLARYVSAVEDSEFYEVPLYRTARDAFTYRSVVEVDQDLIRTVRMFPFHESVSGSLIRYLQTTKVVSQANASPSYNDVCHLYFQEDKTDHHIIKKTYAFERKQIDLEIDGIWRFQRLGLETANLPEILSLQIDHERELYSLYFNALQGRTVREIIQQSPIEEVGETLKALGRTLREVHEKGRQTDVVAKIPEESKDLLIEAFSQSENRAKHLDIILPHTYEEIIDVIEGVENLPQPLALAHPDPHPGNFLYDFKTKKISILDPGQVHAEQALEAHPIRNFYNVLERIRDVDFPQRKEKLSFGEEQMLVESFKGGYASLVQKTEESAAAHFYHLMYHYNLLSHTLHRLADPSKAQYLLGKISQPIKKGAFFPAIAPLIPYSPDVSNSESDWKKALPTMEEVGEKVRCLFRYSLMDAALASTLGGAAALATAVLVPSVRAAYLVGSVAFSTAVGSVSRVAISVFDEMSLQVEAMRSQGDETVVYLMPKRDKNAASHIPGTHDSIRELSKRRKLIIKRVSRVSEINDVVEMADNISHLVLAFHGNPFGFYLDRDGIDIGPRILYPWSCDHFSSRAQIILQGCSTGKVMSRPCFAEEVYHALEGRFSIIAPMININESNIYVEDDVMSFREEGADVTRRLLAKSLGNSDKPKKLQSRITVFPMVRTNERMQRSRYSPEVKVKGYLGPSRIREKIDIKSESVVRVSHERGDRITEALNRISVEEEAMREFQGEVAWLTAHFKVEREGEAIVRDQAAMHGAMSDAAEAARRLGCQRLGTLFQAGHEMMKLEESVEKFQGVKDLASMDGAIAIGSVAAAGASMIGVFATLDNSPSDVLGPLTDQMQQYNAILCERVQEICRQVASFHAETIWEFGRVRNELFSMYEDLKAIQLQVTKEAEFLKQDVTIGFLRVQRESDLFARETKYQMQELRLEELRKVEDGINHYEFGAVSLDKVRGWAATLERWMANSPFKSAAKIRTLAEAAKVKRIVEIEDAEMENLINLDTLEALLPAYTIVLKILREAGAVYDPEGKLWQKMVLDPVRACEVVFDELEAKRALIEEAFAENVELLESFREHFASYKAQIIRIRRSVEEKKSEIKAMPCVMRTGEKFGEAAAKLDASEGLLADKLQALIAALSARKYLTPVEKGAVNHI